MRITVKQKWIALGVASAFAVPSLPLSAAVIEEIVVTAQKREEVNQDVPISITALGTSALENRGIGNSGDLISTVTGISGFESPGSKATTGLSMRGISGGSPANLSLDPAVAIYLDGVFVGKQLGSAMDVAEIERIEVLRGPQGTLYGRNSTGGAVNFISKAPTGEFGFRASASVGSHDLAGFKFNLDLPAIGEQGEGLGRLSTSIGFQTKERDGLRKNYSPGQEDFNTLDRQAWRVALKLDVTDNLSLDYVYDHSELDETNPMEQVVGFTALDSAGNYDRIAALHGVLQGAQYWSSLPGTDPRIASRWVPSLQKTIAVYEAAQAQGGKAASGGYSDSSPSSENRVNGHALTIAWDLDTVMFKSITAYRDAKTHVRGDLENIDSRMGADGVGAYNDLVHLTLAELYGGSGGFSYPLMDAFWSEVDRYGTYHSVQNTVSEYKQFSQELQMVGSLEQIDYAFGLYYFRDKGRVDSPSFYAAPLTGNATLGYDNDTSARAVFAQGTWRPDGFEERLSLTLGLRYTRENKGIDYRNPAFSSLFTGPVAGQYLSLDEDFSNTSGNFTLAYQFTDDLNAFLRYSTGYRSGGFNGEIFDNPYAEETLEQLELGVKSDWWDGRLRVNGSLYTYQWEDVQLGTISTESGSATTSIRNAGEADRWGGELEILVAPLEDLMLGLSYAYIHGDFEDYPDVCGTNLPQRCYSGEQFAKRGTSPNNQLSFTADYTFARTSVGEVTGYLQVNWQSAMAESSLWSGVHDDGNPVIYPQQGLDERTVVNARLSLQQIPVGDGMMRVSLWGNNLTDDDYSVYSINFGSLGPITEQYGAPRTWGMDLSYEY